MKANPARAALDRLRGLAVAARDGLDGLLHTWRRRRAAGRLMELLPRTVLFVCLGNICRSPYAARLLALRAGTRVRAESGGYLGPGRAPPSEALEVARARGIEHADHVSTLVTREQIEAAEVTFVFDRFNVANVHRTPGARLDRVLWLGDFDPQWTGKRAIIDPWGKPLAEYEATFARIDRCVEEIARILTRA
jgi:protein-tyrosine-phosphatase